METYPPSSDAPQKQIVYPSPRGRDPKTGFRLLIYRGAIRDQTEYFIEFQQTYASAWNNIVKILRRLEKLMYEYAVPIAIVDGER